MSTLSARINNWCAVASRTEENCYESQTI